MRSVITRRLLWGIPTLLIVSFLVFVLLELAPGDPARAVAGAEASEETIAEVRHRLGLDEPLLVRYTQWVADAAHLDLGESLVTGRPVRDALVDRLPVTLSLTAVAMTMAVAVALVVGTLPGFTTHPAVDRLCALLMSLSYAVPSFWLALVLTSAFAVQRDWLPALGYVPFTKDPGAWLRHLILPGAALAASAWGALGRQLRGELVEVMQSDYVLAVRCRGVPQHSVVLKHGLKNAAIPVVTLLGIRTAQLLGGTVIVEQIFLIDGLGRYTFEAVLNRDIPVVLGVVFVTTIIVLVINSIVEATYGYLNPRVRRA